MKITDNHRLSYSVVDNGDTALTIIFDEPCSEALTRKIVTVQQLIKNSIGSNCFDIIPAYQSITLIFDLLKTSKNEFKDELLKILEQPIEPSSYLSKLIEIPVCYDSEYALDLAELANYCNISEQQVITAHTSKIYLVHMLGFLPGFLYLGGLSSQLYCPRKNTPATRIPAGSVAIGGDQTGIYPVESPGGWHIIGRTPLPMFDSTKNNPAIASPLDEIKFIAIGQSEFLELQKQYKEANR